MNYTGQKLDGTGLLFYNARYYDPNIAKFVSADTIVPGTAKGKGGSVATLDYDEKVELRPLTVGFHETQFTTALNEENRFTQEKGFYFQLGNKDKEKAKYQWGALNPQALNRYSYVLNNPVRYTDPTGHSAIVWEWENEYYRVIMRDIEKDNFGVHFNIQIQLKGKEGNVDVSNYHVRYHGLQVAPNGKLYWVFSYSDEFVQAKRGWIVVEYGNAVDVAVVAGWIFAGVFASSEFGPAEAAGIALSLGLGIGGKTITQQFADLIGASEFEGISSLEGKYLPTDPWWNSIEKK
jgi:hypothetical protein